MGVDPLTVGLAIASTGLSAIEASSAAKAEQSQLRYQQQVAANNAAIAEDNRRRAIQESTVAAAEKDIEASAILGQIVAEAGASGLDLASGSKVAKRVSAQKLAARDRARIIAEGQVEGGRFAQQRAGFEQRGANLSTAIGASRRAGRLGTLSSLISGAARVGKAFKPLATT